MKRSSAAADVTTVRSRYLLGESFAQIGAAYGVSHECIRQIVKKSGEFPRGVGGLASRLAIETARVLPRAVEGYDRGRSLAEISEAIGLSQSKVRRMLRGAGRGDFWFGMPPAHPERCKRRAENAVIVALYTEGVGVVEVMRRVGVGQRRVYAALDEAGVKSRQPWRRLPRPRRVPRVESLGPATRAEHRGAA